MESRDRRDQCRVRLRAQAGYEGAILDATQGSVLTIECISISTKSEIDSTIL